MAARAWDELSDLELDQLRNDLEDARGAREALEEERDRLMARIEKLEHARDDALEKIEGLMAEPADFHEAAERLLELLDAQLGVERYEESNDVHDLFSAMRELRDAMSQDGWRRRCNEARALFTDKGRQGGNSKEERSDDPT